MHIVSYNDEPNWSLVPVLLRQARPRVVTLATLEQYREHLICARRAGWTVRDILRAFSRAGIPVSPDSFSKLWTQFAKTLPAELRFTRRRKLQPRRPPLVAPPESAIGRASAARAASAAGARPPASPAPAEDLPQPQMLPGRRPLAPIHPRAAPPADAQPPASPAPAEDLPRPRLLPGRRPLAPIIARQPPPG